jgi:hypothetical protein
VVCFVRQSCLQLAVGIRYGHDESDLNGFCIANYTGEKITLSQRLARLSFTWKEPFDIVVVDSRPLHRPIGRSSMAAATREVLWLSKLAASLRMTLSQAGVPIAIKVDNKASLAVATKPVESSVQIDVHHHVVCERVA